MTLPSPTTFAKSVVLVAAALVVIKIVKPYLPSAVQSAITP